MSPPHDEMNGTSATEGGGLKRERQISDDDSDAPTPKALKPSPKSDEKSEHPPRPAPFFFYTDHSHAVDDDPLTPVTPPNTLPAFPIKMHAILSMPELSDVIAWDSHGRSFRILKPKRFERDVLPKYFDHSKFSSFTRQVNGWGFRRLVEGVNMGSYYEENFLRSMPWLVKNMKRPKVGEKKSRDTNYEPDLAAISEQFPVPNHPITREIQVVLEIVAEKGPKAKMPELMLLKEEPFRQIAPPQGSIGVNNAIMPDAQLSSHDSTALQTLLQTLQRNGFNHPVGALPNTSHQQVNAACATAVRPAPSTATLNDLLQTLQRNGLNHPVGALPNTSHQQVIAASAAAVRPTPGTATLNDLLQTLQRNGLEEHQQVNAAFAAAVHPAPRTATLNDLLVAKMPPAPAPSTDLLSNLLLHALQQNSNTGSMPPIIPNTYQQLSHQSSCQRISSASSFASNPPHASGVSASSIPKNIHQYLNQNARASASSYDSTSSVASSTMSMSQPNCLQQYLNQNALADYTNGANGFATRAVNRNALAEHTKSMSAFLAPTPQPSGSSHVGQLQNAAQTLTESQLKGMTTDQLKLLLSQINKS